MPDREKVIKELMQLHGTEKTMTVIFDAITLLKEQETVVRCKDCKHCKYPESEKDWCKNGHLHGNAETWFCADGERR